MRFILGPPHPDTLRRMRKEHLDWFEKISGRVVLPPTSLEELKATGDQIWDWTWSQRSPERMRTLIESSTVDPEDHDYNGDGTSRCRICLDSMNAHLPPKGKT